MKLEEFKNSEEIPDSVKDLVLRGIESATKPDSTFIKPAVVFDGINVYTKDGCVTVDPKMYNAIIGINGYIVNDANNYISELNGQFVQNTIDIAMHTNLSAVCDGFLSTLLNIYCVFAATVASRVHSDLIKPSISVFDNEAFGRGINAFLLSSMSAREDIIKYAICDFAVAFVNNAGISIYNNMRSKINMIIAGCNFEGSYSITPTELVPDIMLAVDKAFAKMMGDMTYECSVFAENIANLNHYLLPAVED